MMTSQRELWEGKFGDMYQERNALNPEEIDNRKKLWEQVLKSIYTTSGKVPDSVLEIGAGQGPNLSAINQLALQYGRAIKLYATEINQFARVKLSENLPNVEILDGMPSNPCADLVFTYGVMIHTHPAHVRMLMEGMHKASNKWLMCAEYFAPVTRAIPYRGETDALWLDDYGSKFMDVHPLRLVDFGFCWKRITGLDNVTFWVFEKREKML